MAHLDRANGAIIVADDRMVRFVVYLYLVRAVHIAVVTVQPLSAANPRLLGH